ncbi:MAG: septal ring lytic transglycosylase RlpA family protein, partial [Candidatus Sericytochromatia bacterium]|nr:septal ring lytic transglycosylase RlpA family protein [Candidatus Sericytochromatia bacterium]
LWPCGTAQALDIYEPDSAYATAPNSPEMGDINAPEVQAKVMNAGAELLSSHPRFANVVVSMAPDGTLRSDLYVNLRRVLTLTGDDGTRAQPIADAVNRAQANGHMRADLITPARRRGSYAIVAGGETLLTVDERLARAGGGRSTSLVLRWLDNMRMAVGGAPFRLAASRGGLFSGTLTGRASWYGPGFNGRRAASGERFNQNSMTAAHKTLPFGTVLLVTNTRNHRSCLVRINDRGPYVKGREIDLSAAAARVLKIDGVGSVRIDILQP